MYNKFMNERELNVKVGDTVSVLGHTGKVTKVIKGTIKEWNGKEYAEVKDGDYTSVRVHFNDSISEYGQYQDGVYGSFVVVE